MSFLDKYDVFKMKQDADRLLLSHHAVSITLEWRLKVNNGTYDKIYHQYDGGTEVTKRLENIKAEKVIVTPIHIERFNFGVAKVGDVIFRFSRDLELDDKANLVIINSELKFYPLIFDAESEELINVAIGNSQLFQSLLCSRNSQAGGLNN